MENDAPSESATRNDKVVRDLIARRFNKIYILYVVKLRLDTLRHHRQTISCSASVRLSCISDKR